MKTGSGSSRIRDGKTSANRILVVDGGRIVENGSPEELMALKGKYYKLVQIQSMTQSAEKMKEDERF